MQITHDICMVVFCVLHERTAEGEIESSYYVKNILLINYKFSDLI